MPTEAPLPPGLVASIAAADSPCVLLLRHSDRYSIARGDDGYETALTPEGERRAAALGAHLGAPLDWATSSPLLRCVRTAELLGSTPTPSNLLGNPGPFVVHQDVGGRVWSREGNERVVRRQLQGETWGCLRPMSDGGALLDGLLDSFLTTGSGRGVAVSHDAIVMPYIRHHSGHDFADDWLAPLDGVVVTRSSVFWRGRRFGRAA